MRIYGKTLSEVFTMLPWPYKAVVVLGAAFFIFAVPYSLRYFVTMGIVVDKVEPIIFPGLSRTANKGMLDPAMATDGKNVVMLHTLLGLEGTGNDQQLSAEVAMETSQPPCRAWATLPNGFEVRRNATGEDEMGPDGINPLPAGVWRAETPGIVFDPDDRGAEWKTYAYRYYWTGKENLARLYSYISIRTAHDIYGQWSDEQPIFGAAKNYPPEPYSGMVLHLNDLNPALQDVYFYSRPSLVYTHKILFMTLSAFVRESKLPDRIVMIYSMDHGKSWKYAGTPLRAADLPKMGDYTKLGGATLIEYPKEKQMYLAAVFGNSKAEGLGAFMLPFDNPIEGKLRLDEKTGAPAIAIHHARNSAQPSKLGGGYSAYSDDCKAGMLMSEYSDLRASFQIFKTYKKPVP